MSVDKFNYQVRSFVGNSFAYSGNRFFSVYALNEANAVGLCNSIKGYLPNYSSLGCSKQVVPVGKFSLPADRPVYITDVLVYRFLVVDSAGGRYSVDVPARPGVNVEDIIAPLLAYACGKNGSSLQVLGYRVSGVDVVGGGV